MDVKFARPFIGGNAVRCSGQCREGKRPSLEKKKEFLAIIYFYARLLMSFQLNPCLLIYFQT